MDVRRQIVLEKARELCSGNNCRLLYLCFFGSELYGTSTGNSDTDVRGIFLPEIESVVLKKDRKSLHYSTGRDNERNSHDDLDIDLWSLENWLLNLLPGGDTGALDLLFSVSNIDCLLFRDHLLDPVFANPLEFLDLANNRAYAQYSLSQAKKYGIKGSRLGAIRAVLKWLESHETVGRLGPYINAIARDCAHESYCFAKEIDGRQTLVLCGKIHGGGIDMREFRERVFRDMEKYGVRAQEAENNQGVDYKALSHALRALDQMEELLLTGKIVFPLAGREKLKAVKRGEIPWPELEGLILARLDEVNRLYEKLAGKYSFKRRFAEDFILSCYGLGRTEVVGGSSEAICRGLKEIERNYNVRVLYAAEAGSRAWGFPSLDSDYDIRFIYIHEPQWYLGVAPELERDVIEKFINVPGMGVLDMSGWELRKALRIYQSGNPQIAEWLLSPYVYLENGELAALMRNSLHDCISQGRMWYHYKGLLDSALKRLGSGNQSAKGLLYAVRPLLIMLWLKRRLGIPPVRIESIAERVIQDQKLRAGIEQLVERKKYSLERSNRSEDTEILAWVKNEYANLEKDRQQPDFSRKMVSIDVIFRKTLLDAYPEIQICLFRKL